MSPIRKGDGTGLAPKGFVEVRTGDGTVLYTAASGFDTSMFQDPVYQWQANDGIGVSDGQEATTWTDSLASLDASAVGNPIYRADQNGFEAVEFDGVDDGYMWQSDGDLPTGDTQLSIAALVYIESGSGFNQIIEWGASSDGDGIELRIDEGDDEVDFTSGGVTNANAGNGVSGSWITIGGKYTGSELEAFFNGSIGQSNSGTISPTDTNRSMGYSQIQGDSLYTDGFIAEVVVCGTAESDQAFSDYHNDRLG